MDNIINTIPTEEEILGLLEDKKFAQIRETFSEMNPADIAALLNDLPKDRLPILFRLLPKELAADAFVEMDTDVQTHLIQGFSDSEIRSIMDEIYLDDAADLVDEMPANVVKRILANTDADTRAMINKILQYPDDSAGSLMTVEYVSLRKNMTVSEALTRVRRTGVDKETIYTCYVTEYNRTLLGIVTAKDLLLAEENELIADIMEEEATEDIEKMAAIRPGDRPYFQTSVWQTFLARIPWLLFLMISATFTSLIITRFEDALSVSIILTGSIPMLMDTGGNCGGQASVTIIRSLSLEDVEFRDIFKVIWKELRVGLMCGIALAIVNFGKMMILHQGTVLMIGVISLALFCAVVVAKLIGCVLPMVANKIGFDPAVMSSPFITTIVDALTLLIYFNLAVAILHIA